MMMAFYKANQPKATFLDKFITFFSRGDYSHVELILDKCSYGDTVKSFSSRPSDGLVSFKEVTFNEEEWALVDIGFEEYVTVTERGCGNYVFKDYDRLGAILSVLDLNFNPSKSRWYCSEVVEQVLIDSIDDLQVFKNKTWQSTPNKLFQYLSNDGYTPI